MSNLTPLERDRRCTFRTYSGEFVIPAELFDEGREDELAYHFASSMPKGARSAGSVTDKDGNATVKWRRIRIIELPA